MMDLKDEIKEMSIDEAIKIIGNLDCKIYAICESQDAKTMAIYAMEKQIPKKPTYEGDGYDDKGNMVYDTWYCPNCNKSYEVDYDEYDYCPNCGQKINWDRQKGDKE